MIKRAEFYRKYGVSGAVPIGKAKGLIPTFNIANTIKEFIDKEFPGLVDIYCEPMWDNGLSVMVCPEIMAYFFKNLLAAIYGRDAVSIDIICTDDQFTVIIRSNDHLPIECLEMSELTAILGDTGFTYKIGDDKLTLSAPCTKTKRFIVRSFSVNHLRAKFVEIFFTGGPPPDTDGVGWY